MTEFSQALRAPERTLSLRGSLTLSSGAERTLTAAEIISYTIEEGTGDGLLPGAVLSSSHRLELANAAGEWLENGAQRNGQPLVGATARIELGARLSDGSWAFQPLGAFIVDEASGAEGSGRLALSGGDSIGSELYMPMEDELTYPATLADVWREAVRRTRYAWSGTVPNGGAVIDAAPDWRGGSVRQALSAAAMAAGCFVRVDRAGGLELVPCLDAATPVEIAAESYLSLNHLSRAFGPVRCLQVTPVAAEGGRAEAVAFRTNGAEMHSGNTVRIENNPLFREGAPHLEALCEGTLAALEGLTLRAASFRWRGDPALRVGDPIRVTDRRGNAVETRVLRQTLRFAGGFSAEVACDIARANDSGVPRAITPEGGVNANLLTGTVDGGLLAAESVLARSIAAEAITAEKLAAASVTADKLDAESVDARVLSAVTARIAALAAGEITTDALYAALADIARAEIGSARIGSAQLLEACIGTAQIADAAITRAKLGSAAVGTAQIALGAITAALIENGAVGTVQIADGSITDAKIVALTADKINAGTLAAQRLLLRGEGGLFYEINAQAGGLTASQLSAAEYRQAISGTALVARSVTADRLAAHSVTANELAAHTITAAEIDVAALFAAEATVDALNAMDIRGNEFLKLSVQEAVDAVHVGGRNYILSSRTLVREGVHGLVAREWRARVGQAAVGTAMAG